MALDTLSIRGAYRGKTLEETTIKILCDEIDRLRAEAKPTPQQQGVNDFYVVAMQFIYNDGIGQKHTIKLVSYRAASVDEAVGKAVRDCPENYNVGAYRAAHISALTATLPVPEEKEIQAEVSLE